ncbi:hypothetical protein OGM63_16000 [Plectonema radiosum NIES-515]|uniref:Transposase n=1 Tax=Plectonema radiosum NIES-515 TaxID=2986073 RepID=A0ABT3B0V1_9CYAN|nr:hypothetical protein [Plectonema radiosum]MCV3214998.1 hypothetical protein [Plectonema radiosum NIES-515]
MNLSPIQQHHKFLLSHETPVKTLVNLIQFALVVGIGFKAIFQHLKRDVRSQTQPKSWLKIPSQVGGVTTFHAHL